ncbi:hypothetical protein CYY_001360 [Polysphondylium violaceum]|uniref:Lysosomal dipeptide transporter MFSD1 n=1 Tax=Polysphondylium violaceum TaxID=133409 RepID=A0A8J4V812_9MYCE|nr:hypothetical protein CYY_001360 [Polysphondylium violaceum]
MDYRDDYSSSTSTEDDKGADIILSSMTVLDSKDDMKESLVANIDTLQEQQDTHNNDTSTPTEFKHNIKSTNKIQSILNFLKNEKKKIIVTFLIINLGFPLYLSYNNPTSMVKVFNNYFNLSPTQFGNLYTVYALPNLFMVFLGGIVIDMYGSNRCSIIFSGIMTLSAIFAALSTTPPTYSVLLLSRILLGIGGESLLVCVNCFITEWYPAKEISLIIGLESAWVQFGSLFAFGVLPSMYAMLGSLPMTEWVVALIAIISFILNLLFIIFSKKLVFAGSPKLDQHKLLKDQETGDMTGAGSPTLGGDNLLEVDLDEEDYIDGADHQDQIHQQQQQQQQMKIVIVFQQLKQAFKLVRLISSRMWLVIVIAFFGYSSFFGFDIICTDMVIEKYGYSDTTAALMMAAETLCTGACSPVFGWINKKLRRKILSMGIGAFVMGFGIVLVIITPASVVPMPFIIISGLGYGLFSNAVYSSVPTLVDANVTGTSFGLISTSYNAGIVLFPLFLSAFKQATGNYNLSMWTLVLSAFITIALLVFLKKLDEKEKDTDKKMDAIPIMDLFKFINKSSSSSSTPTM